MKPKATTNLYCIIGSPVRHSLSPDMHNTAFEEQGLDNTYLAFDVGLDELDDTVSALKTLGAKGFNITTPLKEGIVDYCDELSEVSKLTGSVNTVKIEDGKLYGTTTDGIGFFNGLKDNGVEVEGKKLLLLGAGGAARVIASQAMFEGVDELVIFNRTLEKAKNLKEKLKDVAEKNNIKLKIYPLSNREELSKELKSSDILVNATTVGMQKGNENLLIDPEDLTDGLVVCEIVYKEKTKLMEEAEKRGLKVVDGLPMLLFQGAESYEIWTGNPFPIGKVKEIVFNI